MKNAPSSELVNSLSVLGLGSSHYLATHIRISFLLLIMPFIHQNPSIVLVGLHNIPVKCVSSFSLYIRVMIERLVFFISSSTFVPLDLTTRSSSTIPSLLVTRGL